METIKKEKPNRNKKQNYNKSGKQLARRQQKRQEALARFQKNLEQYQNSLDKSSKTRKDKTVDTTAMEMFTSKVNKMTAIITHTENAIQSARKY